MAYLQIIMVIAGLVSYALSSNVPPQTNICPSNISYCYGNFTEYIAKPLSIDTIGNETYTYCQLKNTLKFYNLKMNVLLSINGGNKKQRRKAFKLLNNKNYIEKASSSTEVEHLGSNICDINYCDIQLISIKNKYEKSREFKKKVGEIKKNKFFFGYMTIIYIFSVSIVVYYRV